MSVVYATPGYVSTLATSTPISAHVPVDYELHGCPVNKHQLLEVVSAYLNERRPAIPSHSVCIECKRRGNVCVMVAHGTPCLGPVTHAGCGAICPSYHRGCYGCFGPMESPNTQSLATWFGRLGATDRDLLRSFRSFNADAEPFRAQSETHA
jgi:coenzyme F420-reducing hydrogenase gamma subunit